VNIKSSFNDYEPLFHDAAHSPSRGDMPRELEDAIDRTTREEFESEFRRLYALRLLNETGGVGMSEEMGDGDGKSRLLEERDIPSILEALFTEEFYQNYADSTKNHLTWLAKQGLGRYENYLVVERDDKAVGGVGVDTPYPPYAELGGLLVHPQYRRKGVGTELVEGCINLAKRCDCNIMYLMTLMDIPAVLRFYRRLGFQPAMLQGFDEDDKEICLFRFTDVPCYNEFLRNHPLSIMKVSGGKGEFHGNKAFEIGWSDPQTGDFLSFYLDGARWAMRMPRITGISRKEGPRAFDAWIHLTSPDMAMSGTGEYEINLDNEGEDKMNLHMSHLLPKGTTIDGQKSYVITTVLEGEARWKLRFNIMREFDVPPLSFYTVLATCQLQLDGFSSPFPISAGFEVKRS